jgi:hypothetical protein
MPAAPPAIFIPPSAGSPPDAPGAVFQPGVGIAPAIWVRGFLADGGELVTFPPMPATDIEDGHQNYLAGLFSCVWYVEGEVPVWNLTAYSDDFSAQWTSVEDVPFPWLVSEWTPVGDATGTPEILPIPEPPLAIFDPIDGGSPGAPAGIYQPPIDGGSPGAPAEIFEPMRTASGILPPPFAIFGYTSNPGLRNTDGTPLLNTNDSPLLDNIPELSES